MATEQSRSQGTWQVQIVTLFPEMFPGPLDISIIGNARAAGIWTLATIDLRAFGIGRHHSVDDTPAGGGPGMVMRCDVVGAAIDQARAEKPDLPAIYLSPRGEPMTQRIIEDLAAGPGVLLLAGRFEGVDERVIEARGLRELSIGDYVISGGELAAYILVDACVRQLPGVLGADASLDQESFREDLLEYPQYTRPREWEGRQIPDILLSGDHARISDWRRRQSEGLTAERRPDLDRRRK